MADEKDVNNIPAAFDIIKDAMKADRAYAWSWHCNVAMGFYDVGGDHWLANQGAARFMQICFGVDVSQFPEYLDIAEFYKESVGG